VSGQVLPDPTVQNDPVRAEPGHRTTNRGRRAPTGFGAAIQRYLSALIPLLVGLIGVGLRETGVLPNTILYLRADLGTLLLLLGVLVTLVWAAALLITGRQRAVYRAALAGYEQEQTDAHHRFIRRLDHEVKNPLTAIRAGLANLGDRDDDPALTAVRAQVDRLARLTGDLRKLADLETQPIEQEPVHLDQLLGDLMELAHGRPGAAARTLRLTLPTAPWPLPPVAGDSDLLFLALHNLLDNAIKFSRPGDIIEVRASEDGASVAVEVADTGPGIPADELAHVGEELYRGRAARSVDGSGLGLALAHAIAARHAGTLAVRSRAGQGTVVTLRLPAAR
jgi:two-component system OmpR family sensor kinase